ncbi:HlyD family secretion protein [Alteromonas sediminis]|nr:HlyD family efflux transporter periplasmic adaptor subunit [Alteromonas sediminis]
MVEQMRTGLFRRQVIDRQGQSLFGKVIVTPQMPTYLVVSILLVWLISGIYWLLTGSYARQVSATGWIEPKNGVVQHFASRTSGTVKSVQVSAGEWVEKDQVLMRIETESYTSTGKPVAELILDQLYWLRADLERQITRASEEFDMQLAEKRSQLNHLKRDSEHLRRIYSSVSQQADLSSENLKKVEKLHREGWVNGSDLDHAKQGALRAQTQRLQMGRELIKLEEQISALRFQLNQLPTQQQNYVANLERQKRENEQRLIQLNAERQEVILAKTSGHITEVLAIPGQRLNVSKPLLSIMSNDKKMEATILLPVNAAGFVQTGQALKIRYDAFPHEKFGLFNGTVTSISESVLLPNELYRTTVAINEPFYLVRAELNRDSITAYGKSIRLKAGMTLSTQITTGHRSILEWLFEPLLSLKGRV